MSRIMLCVAFGSKTHPAAWASSLDVEELPSIGMRTQLFLHSRAESTENLETSAEEDDSSYVVAEVAHVGVDDDGVPVAYLFASSDLPDDETIGYLEQGHWVRLGDDAARGILTILESSPPAAATHEVMLVLGDVAPDGDPSKVEAWTKCFLPDDPRIPMFGDRMLLDPLDALGEYEDSEDEDSADADGGETPDKESAEGTPYNRWLDLEQQGSDDEGYPALVFFAAKVDAGEAQVAFWIPKPGTLNGFDLLAAGWQQMSVEEFDPIEFRVVERVDLASRTVIRVQENSDESLGLLVDYEVDNAASVRDDQLELLPPVLAEHCLASRELGDIDAIIESWRDGEEPK